MFVIKSRNKRLIMCIMCLILIFTSVYAGMSRVTCIAQERTQGENSGIELKSPSAILMEASTGQVIYEKDADTSLHPASITKIMTLILIFDAIKDGKIGLDEEVTVSEYAASMGGSQVFLEAGEKQTVDTMIKCISMASANDACVTMAEYICGNEEEFVTKMNKRAKDLGMKNTHFVNCNGLDADGHLTTARDIALMSKELITTYPQIFDYCNIWMENIIHKTQKGESEFGLTNTNKLIRQYEYATGLKTGSTSKAKFCVSATGRKDDIDLIAVIMAADDSKARVRDAITLLNYGFGKCQKYTEKKQKKISPVEVRGGREKQVKVRQQGAFTYIDTTGADLTKIENKTRKDKNVKAPLKKGEKVGEIVYYLDRKKIGARDIVTTEKVEKQNYGSALENVLEEYFGI